MKEYLIDYEQLALKYSLRKIEKALNRLRIKSGVSFFPRPHEVAEEIDVMHETGIYAADQQEWEHTKARLRADEERNAPWRARWLASGLTLSEFIAQEDKSDAA